MVLSAMTSRLVSVCIDANDPLGMVRRFSQKPRRTGFISTSPRPTMVIRAEVDHLVALGATRIDIDQGDVDWVVMADPDGNEFCVLSSR